MPPDVLAPARLGPVRLRNRVIKAATFEGATPDAMSSAAAPSEICDESAAVSRPPSTRVLRPAIFSRDVSRRGPSSVVTPSYGTISRSNRPSSMARIARRCEA